MDHHRERHGGPFGGGHWGGGRGRRRVFDGAELRLVLLRLIADEPRHGYELIKAVEDMTGGAYAPSPGVVYPALQMLTEMGHIAEQQSDDSKKRFAVTDEGRDHLAASAEQIAALLARLEALAADRQRTDAAPIRRAMGNLKVALQNRLSSGEITNDTLHDVAALIDEVAQKVERLR
jgi:DNA-binding PadR family transcriptional regulator